MKYEEEALSTLSNEAHYNLINEHLLHGALGIVTEAAEIADAIKKAIFYGKPLDLINIQEEIGDCFWYLAVLARETGAPFEDIMAQNIAKLRARYPDKFTEEAALNRDLDAERLTLEAKHRSRSQFS